MAQILHLIDAASPQASPTTLSLLAATIRGLPNHRHEVLLLGGDGLIRDAVAADVPNPQRLTTPGGRAVPGCAAVARWLRGRDFNLIHCWSMGTLWLAAMLRRSWPRLLSLTVLPEAPSLRWLAWLLKRTASPTRITTMDEHMRRCLMAAGVDEALIRIVPPTVDASMIDVNQRGLLRESWGIEEDDGQPTCVIALLSDPPLAADALWASLGVGLVYESLSSAMGRPPSLLLLAQPAQHRRLQARKMMNNYGLARLLAQEPRLAAPWQVLPGCDAVIGSNRHGAGLAMRWAAAAGLPMIAETQSGLPDWCEEDRNVLIAHRRQVKRVAHHLHQIVLDPTLARRVGDSARCSAVRHCDPIGYADRMNRVYKEVSQ